MRTLRLSLLVLLACNACKMPAQFETPYEKSGKKRTATYSECTEWYRKLALAYPQNCELDSIGYGDIGKPIYVFRIFSATEKLTQKVRVLINNNIHPGEPEGADASMLLARSLLVDKWEAQILDNVDIHIICQYNVDGTLNRNCCFRANQDGPEEQGFRANARNLDLNRDFIKMDSRNAEAFVKYFVKYKFHLFIDNHTSNGADYQYTLTWFHTMKEKLHPALQQEITEFDDIMRKGIAGGGLINAPYVETVKVVPDSGIAAFMDGPRYATGFAALHHCMGWTVETHMLKPFPQRVDATLAFMRAFVYSAWFRRGRIQVSREEVDRQKNWAAYEPLKYHLDMKNFTPLTFKGYEFTYKKSPVTGMDRLFYDRTKPFEKIIPYYDRHIVTDSVKIPDYYIIPFAWKEVIQRLQINGVKITRLPFDTTMKVQARYITSYGTTSNAYEGHYLHYNIETRDTLITRQFFQGDYIVPTAQPARSFIAAVLEPRAPDSYFAWNFFDGILMQKEWFSDYVFVDKAEEILNKDPKLKKRFEAKKSSDQRFAESSEQQLSFIYNNSKFVEKTVNLYPVFGI